MTEQGDDYDADPWDFPVIDWFPPVPLCLCGHERVNHNHDRTKSPCTRPLCGCLSWRTGTKGVQTGRAVREVDL